MSKNIKSNGNIFGRNLKYLLTEKGIPSETFAKDVKVSVQNVNNWLIGRNVPRRDILLRASKSLSIPPDKLLNTDITKNDPTLSTARTKAIIEVLLIAISELIAAQKGKMVDTVRTELEEMVKSKIPNG